MPVLIKEFETIAESAPQQPAEQQAPQESQDTNRLRPFDIKRIREHQWRRMARVKAD